jgi:CspA family cold shock protein
VSSIHPKCPAVVGQHFTHIQADADTIARGFRSLDDGQSVDFTWEQYPQDGYEFRVIAVRPAADTQ